ncbi:MAG: hypothetical protein K0R17_2236 [Rariglobus sp.]|jgi:hypothetical protein|nr:hypothetical protein [Rariglobus sp.]
MKKANTTTQPELPAAGAPAKPVDPVLDLKVAKSIPAYRHEKTARTVAYHQAAGDVDVHLFSATGNFIATVTREDAAANEPKVKAAPAAETPAA